jgi:photosystem II stability/assembly factor-like uncharacterized protein
VNDSNIFIGTPNGVLKSIKGRSIEKADSGLDSMTSIYSIATNNLYTYLATTSGVYMSTDNGSSWTAINNGLPASISQVYSVAASPSISGGTNLYAGTYYGVYMSTNNGVNWTASNNGIVGGLQIENLTGSGSYIFAEFSIPPDYNTYSNYISSDYGKTWQDADSSFPTGGRLTMIGTNLYVSNSQGIFISYDYGKTWNSLNENEMDTLYPGYPGILVKSGSNLIVTTKNGLYLSSDKGTSWKPTGTNLPPNLYSIVTIGPDVFAGFVEAGVYISTDNGETWSVDNDTLYTLGEFVSIGSTIFADRGPWFGGDNIPPYKGGVFRSTDFGKTWSYASSGLPANPYPSQLVVHGTDIFVCISQDNFYMSGDNGNSWHKMGSGSENFVYSASLILFVNDSSIFVGANQSGIWQFPLSEITAVKYPLNSAVPAFSVLEQNYPNPFNPSTTIKYQLPMTNFVTLKVYDILGREVETLVNERQSAGTHSVTFNAGGLSSGVYFYRIIAGSFVQTKKLMVIK